MICDLYYLIFLLCVPFNGWKSMLVKSSIFDNFQLEVYDGAPLSEGTILLVLTNYYNYLACLVTVEWWKKGGIVLKQLPNKVRIE